MKKIFHHLISILAIALLISCGGNKTEEKPETKKEIPKALQEEPSNFGSSSRNNLIDAIFKELVEKNSALKKLEDDLLVLKGKPDELTEKFNNYDSKSDSYYGSAEGEAVEISDSLLKKKMKEFILTSSKQYSSKISEINSLINSVSKKDLTLNDHHLILKIVLTMPIIEKYQNDNLPDKNEFKVLMKKQTKLLNLTDSLTPKY